MGSQSSKNTKYECNKTKTKKQQQENKIQSKIKSNMMIEDKTGQQAEKKNKITS